MAAPTSIAVGRLAVADCHVGQAQAACATRAAVKIKAATIAVTGRKGIRILAEANRQVVQRHSEARHRTLWVEREDLVDREGTTTDSALNERTALTSAVDRQRPGHIQVAIMSAIKVNLNRWSKQSNPGCSMDTNLL